MLVWACVGLCRFVYCNVGFCRVVYGYVGFYMTMWGYVGLCSLLKVVYGYINNSLHLARKYARIFVRGHYLFREANSFPRAKLEENCELRGTDNVQGQISEPIFAAKLRLLCLLSIGFKNWGISSDIPQF